MEETRASTGPLSWLLCRVGKRRCAVPLDYVSETMRIQAVMPLADAAGLAVGASIIRGTPVPVVDVGMLFGELPAARARLVAIDVGGRLVALAVDDVLGVGEIADDMLRAVPPLLSEAAADVVRSIGILDGEFLLCLEASRLIPDVALEASDPGGPAA